MSEISNTKRIARNTLMLYFRQILIMAVSLYTVRVVLNVLGAEDYGIYNVVAGVVVLFSFVNNAMATSIQRFLNFELGKGNIKKVNAIYSTSLILYAFIAILFVVISETIGLWFIIYKLNIPCYRSDAAKIVYQYIILATVFSILRVPYHALVIAYERMSFFAILSFVEALFKLFICFLLCITKFDKLCFYAFLITVVGFVIAFLYKIYCNKKIETAHFSKIEDKSLLLELAKFSGWNLFGASANVANQQGINIVLNIFTNVTVNTAMGIANQVNSAVYSFVSNFQMAFNPQLVKSYAAKEKEYFSSLVVTTAKFSFFLLLIIVVPLHSNIELVLTMWLKHVPNYSIEFVRLILIWSLVEVLSGPLWMSVQATGEIKAYQVIVSVFILLNLPCSIFALKFGFSPTSVLIIRIMLNIITLFWRCFYLQKNMDFEAIQFILQVIFRCFLLCICSFLISHYICSFFNSVLGFFVSCFIITLINCSLIWFLGMNRREKCFVKSKICFVLRKNSYDKKNV